MAQKPEDIDEFCIAFCNALMKGEQLPETVEPVDPATLIKKLPTRNTVTPNNSLIKMQENLNKRIGFKGGNHVEGEDDDDGEGEDEEEEGGEGQVAVRSTFDGYDMGDDEITLDSSELFSEDNASEVGDG